MAWPIEVARQGRQDGIKLLLVRILVPDQPEAHALLSAVFLAGDHVQVAVLIDIVEFDAVEFGSARAAEVERLPPAVDLFHPRDARQVLLFVTVDGVHDVRLAVQIDVADADGLAVFDAERVGDYAAVPADE